MLRLLKKVSLILSVGFSLCLHTPALAGMPGDAAPELHIKAWVQGGPFTLNGGDGRSIYVIEFWQTDCPHCLESLPYLSILQEKYKKEGVVFIGITSEDAATVSAFLKGNQDAEYALAVDDEDKTYDAYMGMFNVSGVPHAFVIGPQGRVLWQGHPMDDLEAVLERIVTGRFNLIEARNADQAAKLLTAYVYLAVETEEHDLARQTGERVYAYSRNHPELLTKLARFILTNQKIKEPDLELAASAAKRACVLTGEVDPDVLEVYADLLERMGSPEEAEAMRTKAKRSRSNDDDKNASLQNPQEN